jgi:DNA-binding LacI/PurR family transcriptional regulator
VALESRQTPVILSCHEDPIYAERLYKNSSARGIKSFINISVGFSTEFYANFKQKENLNVPLVFLDVVESDTHSLTIDTPSAIGLAVNHLLDHGFDDLALINCPVDWSVGREALKGFRLALEKRGIEFSQSSVFSVPDFGYQAGRFVIKRMIRDDSLPRAIVTVSDNLAVGAISELKDKGLHVPQDVAIIGYNDILPSSIIDPRLSSVALPLYEMGKQTMLTLNKVTKGNMLGWVHKTFSGHLVIRDSCGCES